MASKQIHQNTQIKYANCAMNKYRNSKEFNKCEKQVKHVGATHTPKHMFHTS